MVIKLFPAVKMEEPEEGDAVDGLVAPPPDPVDESVHFLPTTNSLPFVFYFCLN